MSVDYRERFMRTVRQIEAKENIKIQVVPISTFLEGRKCRICRMPVSEKPNQPNHCVC